MTLQLQGSGRVAPAPAELQARKPTRIRLDPSLSGEGMIWAVTNANLEDLRHNLQVFMITGDSVSVHKSRVSARRLRVVLKGIGPWLLPETRKWLVVRLKLIMAILHPLRQLDVVTNWQQAAGIGVHDSRYERAAMVADAQARISTAGLIGFVDEYAKLMQSGTWRRRDTQVLDQPCLCIVPGIIERSVRQMNRAGTLEWIFRTTGDYHTFRKDLKCLRYWLEFARSLFAKKDIAAWRKTCRSLQSALGTVNDLDEARMTGHDRLVAGGNWGVRRATAADLAASLAETLHVLPRFWR